MTSRLPVVALLGDIGLREPPDSLVLTPVEVPDGVLPEPSTTGLQFRSNEALIRGTPGLDTLGLLQHMQPADAARGGGL